MYMHISFSLRHKIICDSLQNFSAKDFKNQFIGANIKQIGENKNTTNEYRYFLESNFVGVHRLFVLVYSNQDVNSKRIKTR